jgi:hypothetical protein
MAQRATDIELHSHSSCQPAQAVRPSRHSVPVSSSVMAHLPIFRAVSCGTTRPTPRPPLKQKLPPNHGARESHGVLLALVLRVSAVPPKFSRALVGSSGQVAMRLQDQQTTRLSLAAVTGRPVHLTVAIAGSGSRSRVVFVALRLARLPVCGRGLPGAWARVLVPVVAKYESCQIIANFVALSIPSPEIRLSGSEAMLYWLYSQLIQIQKRE